MGNNVQDGAVLRKVYLLAYDSFAIIPGDIVDALDGVNNRYARELLGVLTNAGLLAINEGDDGDVWQTSPETYDTMDRDQAEAKIDAWLAENGYAATQPKQATKSRTGSRKASGTAGAPAPGPCLCGCGEAHGKGSYYRPGHDARHAGQIGREIAANYATKGFDRRELLAKLPSDSLRSKAEGVAERLITKLDKAADKPKPKPEAAPVEEGTVKVGKTERAAKRQNSKVVYMDDAGNWQPASATATKTFKA